MTKNQLAQEIRLELAKHDAHCSIREEESNLSDDQLIQQHLNACCEDNCNNSLLNGEELSLAIDEATSLEMFTLLRDAIRDGYPTVKQFETFLRRLIAYADMLAKHKVSDDPKGTLLTFGYVFLDADKLFVDWKKEEWERLLAELDKQYALLAEAAFAKHVVDAVALNHAMYDVLVSFAQKEGGHWKELLAGQQELHAKLEREWAELEGINPPRLGGRELSTSRRRRSRSKGRGAPLGARQR